MGASSDVGAGENLRGSAGVRSTREKGTMHEARRICCSYCLGDDGGAAVRHVL
jgi:hypothetical protein